MARFGRVVRLADVLHLASDDRAASRALNQMSANLDLEGRLLTIELVLSTMLANVARTDPAFLGRLNEVLVQRMRSSVQTGALEFPDLADENRSAFVEAAGKALDKLVRMTQALSLVRMDEP